MSKLMWRTTAILFPLALLAGLAPGSAWAEDVPVLISLVDLSAPVVVPDPAYVRGPAAAAGPNGVIWTVFGEEGHTYVIAFVGPSPFKDNLFAGEHDQDIHSGPPRVNSGEFTYQVFDRTNLNKVIATGKVVVDSTRPRCTTPTRDSDTVRPTLSFSILDDIGLLPPISITFCTNAEVKVGGAAVVCHSPISTTISGFVGGTASVPASIRKIGEGPTIVKMLISDLAHNVRECDPVVTQVVRSTGRPVRETFSGISWQEHAVTIVNGSPGLNHLEMIVNGRKFPAGPLWDGEEKTLDISSAMLPGDRNVVTLKATGEPGGSATVLIWEGPSGTR